MLLLDRALRRESGGANNPEGLGGRNRKTSDIVNVDNIHSDKPDRPSGTSSAAGLRRLEKGGHVRQRHRPGCLDQVLAGRKSVHAANVDCGFRKSTKVDRNHLGPLGPFGGHRQPYRNRVGWNGSAGSRRYIVPALPVRVSLIRTGFLFGAIRFQPIAISLLRRSRS
jgi:hypothetical protein